MTFKRYLLQFRIRLIFKEWKEGGNSKLSLKVDDLY